MTQHARQRHGGTDEERERLRLEAAWRAAVWEARVLRRSWSYRVGRWVVWPLSVAKAALDRWRERQARVRAVSRGADESQVPSPPQVAPNDPALRERYARLKTRPSFAIQVCGGKDDPRAMEASLGSLERQVYEGWTQENGEGEWVCFVAAGDGLSPDALLELAARIEAEPDADVIYSDEDGIDAAGHFVAPYYKPDWSPELLLSHNYVGGLLAIRRDVLDEIGEMREDFDDGGWHDLALRATERASHVAHIPKRLYHRWLGNGPLWRPASSRALEEALTRRGMEGTVEDGLAPGLCRVRPAVDPDERVAVVILTRDAVDLLRPCVESILALTDHPSYEILVVSNNSTDPATMRFLEETCEKEERFDFVRMDEPFNFSTLNNRAAARTDAPYLLFLNNDTEVAERGWMTAMLETAQLHGVGAVGARLLFPDGTIQHAGVVTGMFGIAGHPYRLMPEQTPRHFCHVRQMRNCSAVSAACLLVRREAFDAVGGMNPDLAVAMNDVDFCLELGRYGYRVVYTPHALLWHRESATRGSDTQSMTRHRFNHEVAYMASRWGDALYRDPYHNPNLALFRDDMSVKKPGDDERLRAFREDLSME